MPSIEFRNNKNFKGHLAKAILTKINESERCELHGKKNYLICDSTSTTTAITTETWKGTFKIQSGLWNCKSKKVHCLLKYKVSAESP